MFTFRQDQQYNYELTLAQMDLYARTLGELKD